MALHAAQGWVVHHEDGESRLGVGDVAIRILLVVEADCEAWSIFRAARGVLRGLMEKGEAATAGSSSPGDCLTGACHRVGERPLSVVDGWQFEPVGVWWMDNTKLLHRTVVVGAVSGAQRRL